MTQTSTTARQTAETLAVAQFHMAPEVAAKFVANLPDDQVDAFLAAAAEEEAKRAALLAKVQADPALRSVICPAITWKTADDRYDVARRAYALVKAAARKANVEVADIVRELIAQDDSIQREIEMYGEDPRTSKWGRDFYGFRFRLTDAIAGTKREEKARKWAAKVARHEAKGEVVCDHCGGKGGADHWPGFTCFECNGAGFVPAKRR